jgi:hypothetical protein
MDDLFNRENCPEPDSGKRKEIAKERKEEIPFAFLFASLASFAVNYASEPEEMIKSCKT